MTHLYLRSLAALALLLGIGLLPASASTVVVPDEYATVQAAIDAGPDTVLIRPGTYPERPAVDRPLVLQGIGDGRPRLGGLDISNLNFSALERQPGALS